MVRDMFNQSFLAQIKHLLRRINLGKQRLCGTVHANIGGLRRQRHSDQQRVRVHMVQLTFGFGRSGLKPGKNLEERWVVELSGHTCFYGTQARPRQETIGPICA